MKKQLTTAVKAYYYPNSTGLPKIEVVGIVFFTRRTKILKRLVREIIYTARRETNFSYLDTTIERVSQELDNYVYNYYNQK